MNDLTLQLAVGGRYFDRTRKVVWKVTSQIPGIPYPFWAENSKGQGQSFTDSGRWSNHLETELDLVEAL